MTSKIVIALTIFLQYIALSVCCDLQEFFSDKRVSVEESSKEARVIFRGLVTAGRPTEGAGGFDFIAHFQLVNTYKGADSLMAAVNANNFRQINVTFSHEEGGGECSGEESVPAEYLVFCVTEPTTGAEETARSGLRAVSVVRWAENIEQRVWKALGWSEWSDWSACSVSCSGGIQQRTRHCLLPACPEYNVEQRHCNLFGCYGSVNPLALEERRYFHPSRMRWEHVQGRPNAWRLRPNSYIWVPAQQLFTAATAPSFPTDFTLFVTLRLHPDSEMGTIFSLRSRRRQDAYLSLELAGDGGVNLVHAAAANGTDVVRIPAKLDDGKWHQLAISVRDDSTVQSYVDCEWLRTDILRKDSLDTPEDSDLIIGYLFSGDLEQMTIVPDSSLVSLQCSPTRTPIIDFSLESISATAEVPTTTSIKTTLQTTTETIDTTHESIVAKKGRKYIDKHHKNHHKKKKYLGSTLANYMVEYY